MTAHFLYRHTILSVCVNRYIVPNKYGISPKYYGLVEADKNLSNLSKFIDKAIAMSCNLGSLWKEGDFSNRQKLQNLLFPSGIYFDKNTDGYRTDTENEVFKTFRLFSGSCRNGQEKATTEVLRLSPCVGMRRLERPTPTSRT